MLPPRGTRTKDHAKSRGGDVDFVPCADDAAARKRCDRRMPRPWGTTTKDHAKSRGWYVNFVPCADNAVARKRCAQEARARCFARQKDEWENKLIGRLVLATSASLFFLLFSFDAQVFSCFLAFSATVALRRDLRLKGLSFWPFARGMTRAKIKRAHVRRTSGECLWTGHNDGDDEQVMALGGSGSVVPCAGCMRLQQSLSVTLCSVVVCLLQTGTDNFVTLLTGQTGTPIF